MKAACYYQYGGPEQLIMKEVPRPALKPNHVLIRVKAASINSWDYDMLRGHTFIIRVLNGFFKPRHTILGCDVAGIVEATGSDCRDWKPGDEVFGDIASAGFGSFAEYVVVPEKLLARKPVSMSFEEAAALPQAGLLAIQGLRFLGDVKAGQQILINGAGGGVGPIALSYANSKGAIVTCVDKKEKFELMRQYGAAEVIDYTTTDYTKTGKRYDKILDVIAHRSTSDYKRTLTQQGVFVMIGGSMGGLLLRMMMVEPFLNHFRKKKLCIMGYRVDRKELEELVHLYEAGIIRVAIDRKFPLNEIAAAFKYVESGNFKGKILIIME